MGGIKNKKTCPFMAFFSTLCRAIPDSPAVNDESTMKHTGFRILTEGDVLPGIVEMPPPRDPRPVLVLPGSCVDVSAAFTTVLSRWLQLIVQLMPLVLFASILILP